MTIGVCIKWVDRRPELHESSVAPTDSRFAGVSEADRSALELALRAAAAWGDDVLAVTMGPLDAAAVLRDALAAGAHRAVHLVAPAEIDSATVAGALAPVVAACSIVWCGDYSLDRGTGSVPAFLAAHLDAAQALGLVQVELGADRSVTGLRRLDGGRRERLRVTGPAVLSVEGNVAPLRRASLASAIAARTAVIDEVHPPVPVGELHRPTRPYRPRARVLAPPSGSTALGRIQVLTDASSSPAHGETLTLAPSQAAHHILQTLADWGYLPPDAV